MFCPAAYEPHTSIYSGLYHVHAIIPQMPQNGARGFTWAFPAICRVLRLLSGSIFGYAVQPARRWRTHQRTKCFHRYQIPPPRRTLYRSAQPSYYNKVYKGATVRHCYGSMPDGATHRRPCQSGGVDYRQVLTRRQQYRPSAPAERSTSSPIQGSPAACVWHRSAVRAHRVSLAPSTRRGSPATGRGGRRGTIDGFRRISFRAFAR